MTCTVLRVCRTTAKQLLTALTHLRVWLISKKVTSALLTHLGKCKCVTSKTLTSLYLGKSISDRVTPEDRLGVLHRLRLTRLSVTVPSHLGQRCARRETAAHRCSRI